MSKCKCPPSPNLLYLEGSWKLRYMMVFAGLCNEGSSISNTPVEHALALSTTLGQQGECRQVQNLDTAPVTKDRV